MRVKAGMAVLVLSVMLVLAASQTNPCAVEFGAFCSACSSETGLCTECDTGHKLTADAKGCIACNI